MKQKKIEYVTTEATAIIDCVQDELKFGAIAAIGLYPVYMEYGSEVMALKTAAFWLDITIEEAGTIKLPAALKVIVERPAKLNRLAKPGKDTKLKVDYFINTCKTVTYLQSLNEEAIELLNQGDTEAAVEAAFQQVEGA